MLLNREFVGTWVWGGLFPSFRLKYTFKDEQSDLENGIVFQTTRTKIMWLPFYDPDDPGDPR